MPAAASGLERRMISGIGKWLLLQKRIAVFLQKTTNRFSTRAKKWWVILFFILGGGSSILLIGGHIFSTHHGHSFTVTGIRFPNSISGANDRRGDTISAEAELVKIEAFRQYVDSLPATLAGRKIKDSLLVARPGLMDSIRQFEKLYQLLQTTK